MRNSSYSLLFSIEKNNRIGKTRDLFKKIGDTKGTFHAKIGTIKDRNGKDLIEQNRLRRGDKNTQKNYTQKGLNNMDNHDGVITHLEPDIMESGVKWALGSITMNKASGGDRTSAELFKIFFFLFTLFFKFNWRLITLQYCGGFYHTST